MKRFVCVCTVCVLLSGCAITSMDAKLAPSPSLTSSEVGHGQTVSVQVFDERPSKNIGKRSSIGGNIKMNQDLAAIYQAAIMNGLQRKGFRAVGSGLAGAKLKVEIRGLQEISTTGLWTMGTHISGATKVFADNGAAQYEQMYRSEDEHRTIAVSGAKALNAKLNAVVNDQVEQIFNDNALLATLAGSRWSTTAEAQRSSEPAGAPTMPAANPPVVVAAIAPSTEAANSPVMAAASAPAPRAADVPVRPSQRTASGGRELAPHVHCETCY